MSYRQSLLQILYNHVVYRNESLWKIVGKVAVAVVRSPENFHGTHRLI